MTDLTPAQCLEARALLGWSRDRLAPIADVSTDSLGKFERGEKLADGFCIAAVRCALEAAGIIFVDENGKSPGVRLSKGVSR